MNPSGEGPPVIVTEEMILPRKDAELEDERDRVFGERLLNSLNYYAAQRALYLVKRDAASSDHTHEGPS